MAAPFIHPQALVDTAHIGEDTRVWEFTHVLSGAKIGRGCNLCCHCFVENDVIIGDNVTLKSGVYVWDGLRIEDDVFVGPNVTFTNDMHPRSGQRPPAFLKTTLKRGCSIGGGAILLPGVTVGEYAMVGAGALVTRDVAPYTLVYGSPARFVSYINRVGHKVATLEEAQQDCPGPH